MPTATLPGSNTKPRYTKHCISHEEMRPVAGGCDLGVNQWVCADCWQRRRLARGAAPPALRKRTRTRRTVANAPLAFLPPQRSCWSKLAFSGAWTFQLLDGES